MAPTDITPEEARYTQARDRMVERQLAMRGISNPRVLDAMSRVPRHLFVAENLRRSAYSDTPLPIGEGQTISQPYMVGLMTELLQPEPGDRMLEIGVGCGYQTAILARLVKEVIGLELLPDLAMQAQERLHSMGFTNVTIHAGDGSGGYPEGAPYDGILVAAAAPSIPEPLFEQLAEGGRLIIPVGDLDSQVVELVRRRGGSFHIQPLTAVRFVPMLGEHGFKKRRMD